MAKKKPKAAEKPTRKTSQPSVKKAKPKDPAKPRKKAATTKSALVVAKTKATKPQKTNRKSGSGSPIRGKLAIKAVDALPAPPPPPLGGGSIITGDGGTGTVTIACMDISDGVHNVLSILTAAHVVNRTTDSKVTFNGKPIGTVTRIGLDGSGTPIDAALIDVTGNKVHRDVKTAGATFTIQQIDVPVTPTDVVIHGGPHGNDGKVTGVVQSMDANATISRNTLNGEENYEVYGLMQIQSTTLGEPFGKPGDSGAPVMKQISAGKYGIVGLLVAVDDKGFGYAHHMADQPDGPLGVVSLMGIRSLTIAETK